MNKLFRNSNGIHYNAVILLFMAFVAVSFFMRTYFHEPSGDEVLYQYVWEKDDPTDLWHPDHRFERKISSFGEIVQTQILHYQLVNGRSLVHAVEQAFTNHEVAFAIINTAVFLLFVGLIVGFVTDKKEWRQSFILWFCIVFCLLILFPYQESLWTSVNYGLNYLWPATISIGFLIIWHKIIEKGIHKSWNIPIALFALIAGWTHEGFVVALAGGTFLYYCINLKKFRGTALWLCIPFWLSACVMVFAPGNVNRFFHGGGDASFVIKIANGFDNVLHLWMFWLLVVAVIVLLFAGKKSQLIGFCKANVPLILVFIVEFVFSIIANTAPYSHTMVELVALLLIFRYICLFSEPSGKKVVIIGAIATVLFIGQQCLLVSETLRIYRFQHSIVETYKTKGDNVFLKDSVSPISRPFIRLLSDRQQLLYTLTYANTLHKTNVIELLKPEDMVALSNPSEFFVDKNHFSGNAYAYKAPTGEHIWLNPDSVRVGDEFEGELKPVDFFHDVQLLVRIKFALTPGAYDLKEKLEIDTIDSQYGRAYRVHPLPVRKIKSINLISSQSI